MRADQCELSIEETIKLSEDQLIAMCKDRKSWRISIPVQYDDYDVTYQRIIEYAKCYKGLQELYDAAIEERNGFKKAHAEVSRECEILLRRNTELRIAADGLRKAVLLCARWFALNLPEAKRLKLPEALNIDDIQGMADATKQALAEYDAVRGKV